MVYYMSNRSAMAGFLIIAMLTGCSKDNATSKIPEANVPEATMPTETVSLESTQVNENIWTINDITIEYVGKEPINAVYTQGESTLLLSTTTDECNVAVFPSDFNEDGYRAIISKDHTGQDKNNNLVYTAKKTDDPNTSYIAFVDPQVFVQLIDDTGTITGDLQIYRQ